MSTPHIYPITKAFGYVSLAVADLELATEAAEQVHGLRRVHSETKRASSVPTNGIELVLSLQQNRLCLRLVWRPPTRFIRALKSRLSDTNVEFLEERDVYPGVAKLIRFLLPSGHPIELHSSFGETEPAFYPTEGVRPRRLGHALLKVEDIPPVENFLTQILSFRVSDRGFGGNIVWLRCSEIHHSINLLEGQSDFTTTLGRSTNGRCSNNWAMCCMDIKINSFGDQADMGQVTICLPIMRTQLARWLSTFPISCELKTKKPITGGIGPR